MSKAENRKNVAYRVSIISIIVNVVLTALKFVAGILGNSSAMISDSVHSLSDIFSTVIVMVGIKFASKEADEEHRYGHERMESVASIFLAIFLILTSIWIGYNAIKSIISGNYKDIVIPSLLPAIAAIVSIVVKEWMYHFTIRASKKINSDALKADAWHHRSDALSSVGSFIGIFFAMLGFPVMDLVASLVICLLIFKAGYDIIKGAIDKIIDKSCDDEEINAMKEVILAQSGVYKLYDIKTRLFGNKVYVDVEIVADGEISLNEAYEISESVHDELEETFPDIKHCMVHIKPIEEIKRIKESKKE